MPKSPSIPPFPASTAFAPSRRVEVDQPRARPTAWLALLFLTLCFAQPLWHLAVFSLSDDVFSYIILVPFVSIYFFHGRRHAALMAGKPDWRWGGLFLGLGLIAAATYLLTAKTISGLTEDDVLAWQISAYVLLVWGAVFGFTSRAFSRTHLFPLLFLGFMIPLPTFASGAVEVVLQHASAWMAGIFFHVSGTTFFHEGTYFQLPGIALNVAPECSGIRSSLALLVTSVVAAQVFLRHRPARWLLVASVLPLAVVRNGFRVYVIGELCVQRGPQMIDSYIHHHGGPIFFALSLVPFAALLAWLVSRQRRQTVAA